MTEHEPTEAEILELAREVFHPDYVEIWLDARVRRYGQRGVTMKPSVALKTPAGRRELWAMLNGLADGVFL